MWFIASRNRPDAMKELIKAIDESGDKPEVAVMLDGEPYDIDWPEGWHIHIAPEHLELQRAMNLLLKLHPNEKTYGMIVDHTRPRYPGWVKALEDAAGDWNISLSDDGYNRINPKTGLQRIASATCFGGELVRTLGWIWPDFCVHLYGDDAIEELGHELGLFRHVPVRVDDLQFTAGEVPLDNNHKRMYQGKHYALDDRAAYYRWRDTQKPGLIHLLKKVIPKECREETRKRVTVCCIQSNNYLDRGAEYVNNLADMVFRNMPDGVYFRFVCFTDDDTGINQSIETQPLPEKGLKGWWNKLALFKRGVFKPDEQVFFFDLDTLIVGNLGEFFDYSGDLCLLRDFYRPHGLGSGVMSWIPEKNYHIWDSFKFAGFPHLPGGDQAWIEKVSGDCDRWQDSFGGIVSYKAHCKPYPPQKASIVCFHGEPRPHNCSQEWVRNIWKIGGASALDLTVVPNTDNSKIFENVKANEHRAGWIRTSPENEQIAVICGSGPSLINDLEMIRLYKEVGGVIFALNNSAKVLSDNGIKPDFQIILDSRKQNTEFIGNYSNSYLIASQCDPEIFDALEGKKVYQWHPQIEGLDDLFPDRNITLIGGGTTVGLSGMALVYTMGFRKMALFGYDSSFKDGQMHAIPQSRTPVEKWTFDVNVGNRVFKSNAAMAKQAELFPLLLAELVELGCEIKMYGEGLLPYIFHSIAAKSQPLEVNENA